MVKTVLTLACGWMLTFVGSANATLEIRNLETRDLVLQIPVFEDAYCGRTYGLCRPKNELVAAKSAVTDAIQSTWAADNTLTFPGTEIRKGDKFVAIGTRFCVSGAELAWNNPYQKEILINGSAHRFATATRNWERYGALGLHRMIQRAIANQSVICDSWSVLINNR